MPSNLGLGIPYRSGRKVEVSHGPSVAFHQTCLSERPRKALLPYITSSWVGGSPSTSLATMSHFNPNAYSSSAGPVRPILPQYLLLR